MAPRLVACLALLALVLGISPTAAPAAAGPLVCVGSHCRGYVAVPLDRTGKVPGQLELYVSEYLPSGSPKGVVFLLAGGPGQSSTFAFGGPVSLFKDYIQVVYDDRGTGESSRITCGPFVGDDTTADIARCDQMLGPARAFYSTRDNAADMDAVRAALGLDKIAMYGTSYGTKQALAYANEYPTHVDRLLLDSTLLPTGPDVYGLQYGTSVPAGLSSLCAAVDCHRATSDIAGDVVAVANAFAAKPFSGKLAIGRGASIDAELNGFDIIDLAVASDLSDTVDELLPSALRAAHDGRPAELERLWALGTSGSRDTLDQTDAFSEPVFAATMCDDGDFPWPVGTPVSARQPFLDSAVAAFSPSAFGAFGPWVAGDSLASACRGWESTGLSPLASTGFPNVPVLIVSGDRDIRTPTPNARAVAKLFPQATVLVVHGQGHSVLGNRECADDTVAAWLAGDVKPGESSCTETPDDFVLPAVPGSLSTAPALAPGGKVGRTLGAVVATIDELRAYFRLAEDATSGEDEPTLNGLVSGWETFEGLHAYSDVPGVTISSRTPLFGRATLTIGGRAAVHGKLTFEEGDGRRDCKLRGHLGKAPVFADC